MSLLLALLGGGDITVNAVITEADDTLGASVAVQVAGSSAIPEAADTVTASAVVIVGATGISGDIGAEPDIDEDPDTLAASASVLVTASAAITEQGDALSAAASGPVQVVPATGGGGGRVRAGKSQWVVPGLRLPRVPALVRASLHVTEEDDVLACSVRVSRPPRSVADINREWLLLPA